MPLKRLRIYHKIFLTITLSTLVGMVLFAVVKLNTLTIEENKLVEDKINLLKTYTALQFSNPVWHYNKQGLKSSVDAFLNDKEIASITVVSKYNDILIQEDKTGDAYQALHLLPISAPIYYEDELIGQVNFTYSTYYSQQKLNTEKRNYILLTVLIIVSQTLILHFVIKRISRPIESLRAQTQKIANGDLNTLVHVKTKDEFYDLAEDFNRMTLQLKANIDEKNWALDALEKSKSDLEVKVDERTYELKEALNNLQQTQNLLYRSQRVTELIKLIGRIAHEINTPVGNCITAISFTKETLNAHKASLSESLYKTLEESLFISDRNIKKIPSLINRLKDLNYLDAYYRPECLSLKAILEEAYTEVNAEIYHNIPVEYLFQEDIYFIAQKKALIYVFKGLIENTYLHGDTKDNAIKILIDAKREEKTIEILYADTGTGIPKNVQERIYEPFYTTKSYKGHLGLGLFIIQEILFLHLNGTIELINTPQSKTLFKITFDTTKC